MVINAIAQAAAEGQLTLVDQNASSHFIYNNKAVYLTEHYNDETELAHRLASHLKTPLNENFAKALTVCGQLTELDKVERGLLKHLLAQKFCIVDDTVKKNKRVLIKNLILLGENTGLKVLLATYNKNSASVKQKNPHFQQINELLDIDCLTGRPRINAEKPLACDILIIYQASMLNTHLLLYIMRALPKQATLILTGDSNHLPPPGPGWVFYDLITSGRIPVRNLGNMDNSGGPLSQTAAMFSRGEMPPLPEFKPFERKEMFYFIEQETPQKIFKTICGLYSKRLPKSLGYSQLDIQVMSLAKKGPVGAKKLNIYLQARLNKRAGGLKHGGFIYKVNDKIVQMHNNCSKQLLAGQTSLITGIDMYKKELYAQTGDNREITYIFHELSDIRPAYAVPADKTLGHKFRGCIRLG